ncbi:serine/threonine-protein kinase [Streptosporangium sp. NPDC006013]|uniref:serine/threonine-protein kinase n=1 Tax=Streptosporangium sp. NPDC006013 TaxID=3155596 RepID=UPI0033AA1F07
MSGPHPLAEDDPRQVGDYRLTGVLGEGGQGVVYLGQAPSGQPVAVKTLHARMAADPAARERFLREAEITRRVAAFCTARVIDAGIARDRPYLVSEYVRGPSLDELIAQDGPRTGGGLDRLAITTLTALAAIHRAGIVHRDFKPSNVIMGQEGPVVIDFGIARLLEHSTTGSALIGTPAYLSPEQLNGHPAGAASDVFAWAATMVYAATGHPAFSGAIPVVVINAIVTREPDLAGAPDRLRPLLAACLAKDPAARPGITDLFTALTHETPIKDHPGPSSEPPHDRDPVQAGASPAGSREVRAGPGTAEQDGVVPLLISASSDRRSSAAIGHGGAGRIPATGPKPDPPLTDEPSTADPGLSMAVPTAGRTPSPYRHTRRRLGTVLAAAVVVILISTAFWLKPVLTDIPFGTLIRETSTGHQKWVLSVAVGQLDGRPVVVSGGYDGTVRVSDLATGTPIGETFTGHEGPVWSVAVGRSDSRPVAVSGGLDGTLRVWDLATGAPIGKSFTGHQGSVESVVVGWLDGRPVVVSGGLDGTVRVSDLATGAPIGKPFTGHQKWVLSVAVWQLDGRPVVVSGGGDGTVRVSDLATGTPIGETFTGHEGPVESVAVGWLDGRPVVVSGGGEGDHTVRVWDLATGAPIGKPFTGHQSWALGLAVGQLDDGRPVVVSGGYKDHTVRVWDLATGAPIGKPFTGHRGLIESVAVGRLDGRPVVVSGGDDGMMRVWSLGPPYPLPAP